MNFKFIKMVGITILLGFALGIIFPEHLIARGKKLDFTILQWNIWQEGTVVPGGYEAIINEIVRLRPDFVTFSEVRNYNNNRFCDRIVESLKKRGETYYSFLSYDTGLLSRYPIKDSTIVYPLNDDHGTIHRLVSEIDGQEFAVYTAHLDYLSDAYYNVRGVDGTTFKQIDIPESVWEILKFNDSSYRDDAIRAFLEIANKDIDDDRIILLGGDFNEPSHMDWIRETKDLYDHHGMIIPWTVTLILDNAGFVDTYREMYPDVLKYPGFTYPSDNKSMEPKALTWAPKADERDRIDYIWYHPYPDLELKSVIIFGPSASICKSTRTESESKDKFLKPLDVWPTDHKGVFATFRLKR